MRNRADLAPQLSALTVAVFFVAEQYLYCLLDTCGYCGHCAACGEYLATAGRQLAEQLDNAENAGNE